MSKDRLKDSESKYWEGKSSLEEEKYLKETKDDAYFKGLKAAKEEQLKWAFEDFIQQTTTVEQDKIATPKRKVMQPLWKYIGAAAAILIVGLLFLKDWRTEPITDNADEVYVAKPEQKESVNLPVKADSILETEKEDTSSITTQTVLAQQEKKVPKPEPEAHHPRVEIVEESYVMVNGKPVYDEEEVEKIVLASLQVMTNNFQEGREAVDKIKHLKIEL